MAEIQAPVVLIEALDLATGEDISPSLGQTGRQYNSRVTPVKLGIVAPSRKLREPTRNGH